MKFRHQLRLLASLQKIALNKDEAYKILGLGFEASPQDIKRRFRELALKNHPDRVPSEDRKRAEKEFQWISLAYEILSDQTNPGESESHKWQKPPSWKTLVLDVAKKYGLKPIKHGDAYGIEVSPVCGVFVSAGAEAKTWNAWIASTVDWKPLNSLLPIRTEGRIPNIIEFLIEEYEEDKDTFDQRAGASPKAESEDDLNLIHSIPHWESSSYLKILEGRAQTNGDLTPDQRNRVILIQEVVLLLGKVMDPSTRPSSLSKGAANTIKRLQAIVTRLFQGKTLTATQNSFLQTIVEAFKSQARPPKPPKQDPQITKDLALIKSIVGWDVSKFLSDLVLGLEHGDPLSDQGRSTVLMILKVDALILILQKQGGKPKELTKLIALRIRLMQGDTTAAQTQEAFVEKLEKDLRAKSAPSAEEHLKTKLRGVRPDAKDMGRIDVILTKPSPVREATTQAQKIKDRLKAARRAKAAYNIYLAGRRSKVVLDVATVFLARASTLGFIGLG